MHDAWRGGEGDRWKVGELEHTHKEKTKSQTCTKGKKEKATTIVEEEGKQVTNKNLKAKRSGRWMTKGHQLSGQGFVLNGE